MELQCKQNWPKSQRSALFITIASLGLAFQVRIMTLASTVLKTPFQKKFKVTRIRKQI